ncbi:hypothetical protein Salat_1384000 [Sesamum alatum]|uniref:Uncharacterized protein n=1 Tax=Sesamum alatum TaxID=300844 RepID=A0AAE2CL33_9LAMI|nr:hypothetical protein Salat_1384000 [Sesamum alatum]
MIQISKESRFVKNPSLFIRRNARFPLDGIPSNASDPLHIPPAQVSRSPLNPPPKVPESPLANHTTPPHNIPNSTLSNIVIFLHTNRYISPRPLLDKLYLQRTLAKSHFTDNTVNLANTPRRRPSSGSEADHSKPPVQKSVFSAAEPELGKAVLRMMGFCVCRLETPARLIWSTSFFRHKLMLF